MILPFTLAITVALGQPQLARTARLGFDNSTQPESHTRPLSVEQMRRDVLELEKAV